MSNGSFPTPLGSPYTLLKLVLLRTRARTLLLSWLGLVVLFFGIGWIATPAQAADGDWRDDLRKGGIIVEPLGWYHVKYKSGGFYSNRPVATAANRHRLVGISVRITNRNRSTYYFATRNKEAKFRADNRNYEILWNPYGYDAGLNCQGFSLAIEARESIDCLYMLELPWTVGEVRMSVPYPLGHSRGYWTLDVYNKNSRRYLGFLTRTTNPGWYDNQSGDDMTMYPATWVEATNRQIRAMPSHLRPPAGTTFYTIHFWAATDRTSYISSDDFTASTHNYRPMFVFGPASCPVYSWSDEFALCSVSMIGPKNLGSIRILYDFGFREPYGSWKIKLDRKADNYLNEPEPPARRSTTPSRDQSV